MDRPLKLSVATGLLSGPAVLIVYGYILAQFGAGASLSGLALSIFYPPFAFFTVPPILSITGTIALLLRRMTVEQRGIIGFIVFIASIPSVLIVLSYLEYLSRGSS